MRKIFGLLKTLFILAIIAGVIYLGVNFGFPKVKSLLDEPVITSESSETPSETTPEASAPQKISADVSEAGKSIVNALSEIGKSEALAPITQKTRILTPDRPMSWGWVFVWGIIFLIALRFGIPKILGLLFGGLGSGIDSLKNNVGQKMSLLTILVVLLILSGGSELAKIILEKPLFPPELSKAIVAVVGLILALIDFKGRTSWQWNNLNNAWSKIWSDPSIKFFMNLSAFLFHAFATPIFIAGQLAITDIFLVFLTGFSVTGQIVRSFGAQPLAQLNSANIPIFSWILEIFAWFASGSLNFSAAVSQHVETQTTGLTQLLIVWGLVILLMIFKFGRRGSAGF